MEKAMQNGGQKASLDGLIEDRGGASALKRKTGLNLITILKVRNGESVPYVGTARRFAVGLGVDVEAIAWPRGVAFGPADRDPAPPPQHEGPKLDLSELYEDEDMKQAIESEVERRVAERLGKE